MKLVTKFLISAAVFLQFGFVLAGPPPQELVQDTSDRMVSAIEAQHDAIQNDPQVLYSLVEEIILPNFDFERMSSWVLGKHWRSATDQQKMQFTQEFRTLLIRTYATAMGEYSGQKIKYLPVKGSAEADEVDVRTEIEQPGGPSIPITYNLFQNQTGDWKVQDVVIDNTSLVANYRSSFSSQIKRDGLDALIDKLAERNQQKA